MLKKSLTCVCAAVAALCIASSPAAAGAAGTDTKAKIPFDFVVGSKTMPAGDYAFEITAGRPVVTIRGANGERALTFVSRQAGAPAGEVKPQLIFQKKGGKYVLSEVWANGGASGGTR